MVGLISVWDYVVEDGVWRVGVAEGRVCMVVPVGVGCVADRAMRRFAGWRVVWCRSEAGAGVAEMIGEFLRGERRVLPVEVMMVGTEFERRVWSELMQVGFGERISYGELARRCGCVGGARAVGGAVGRNPLLILVPCHRVVAGDGGIGGFSAGVLLKLRLLEIEDRV